MHRIAVAGLLTAFALPASAEDADFRFIASRIESEYQTRRADIPLFGIARFMARPFGVRGLDLAIWQELSYDRTGGPAALEELVSAAAGRGWRPMVRAHSRDKRELVQVFAKPEGKHVHLLVIAIEDDAVMVHVKVNPDRLSWLLNKPSAIAANVGR
jgi:hypothetical protein